MELVKAGREDRVKYQSRTATKQKKVSVLCLFVYSKGLLLQHLMVGLIDDLCKTKMQVGGSSNKQKEHKKNMPLAAIRSKAGRSKRSKKIKKSNSGTQFRGRKAWK